MRGAVRCLDRDRDGCASGGGGAYSDRRVRRLGDAPLSDREHAEYDAIREAQDGGEPDVRHGYTFSAWLSAAGRSDLASEYDLRAAWDAGEDPSVYEARS